MRDTYDIIGYPRLVRLNPNIPWKTRGNGALCIHVGKLGGKVRRKIGEINGQDVSCSLTFTKELSETEQQHLYYLIKNIIEEQAHFEDENTNPGFVLLSRQPEVGIYQKAVTSILSLEEIRVLLKKFGASFEGYKNNRGLIGATAAIAWEPLDRTYELITYRLMNRWGTKRQVDPLTVRFMNTDCTSTFDSYDERNRHSRIAPNSPCPILYGIRGDDVDELLIAKSQVKSEPVESWLYFETNQGTDDHLQRKNISEIQAFESVIIDGSVSENPYTLQGGHVLFTLQDATGTIPCAAYEPTKEFRHIIRLLRVGDGVEVYGGVREQPLTINLEKIQVKSLTTYHVKTENPICPTCGKHMKSRGTEQGYKCIRCGTTSVQPTIEEQPRALHLGWYEVPVCARRHLSKPLKRMKQPIVAPLIIGSEGALR
jgi:tRNA(Ile2)-agmatinylcytidine synthase